MTLTPLHIRVAFPLCQHVITPDASYAAPTLDWLTGPFWSYFRTSRAALGTWTRRNDCDNFARAYAQAAQDAHALTAGNDADALAAGEVFYFQAGDPARGHAINCAFVGADASLVFIEPQTGQPVTLSTNERNSVFFVRF